MKILNLLAHITKNKKRVYTTIALSITAAFILTVFSIFIIKQTPVPQQITSLNINSLDSIIIINDSIVPPILYNRMPDVKSIDYQERKQHFINIMLPTILIAQEIIKHQRAEIIRLRNTYTDTPDKDSMFIDLMKKFKAKSIDDLIIRMHPKT